MTAVHQFVATFEPGAIGSHMLQVQRLLREQGYESEIFAEFARGEYEPLAYTHTDYGKKVTSGSDDVLMYHMAIGSVVADWLNDQPQRLVVVHHNITPVSFYEPWNPGVTYGMAWGRDQLAKLASKAILGIAVSEYNRRELDELNYHSTALAPILLDLDAFNDIVDEQALAKLLANKQDGSADWLFVGWIAPHKCQHDIITAFAAYRKLYDANARLHLVGRVGEERYNQACHELIAELDLGDNVFVHGRVTDGELVAHYRSADALVCMSEHEGVGLPLIEAMHYGVPVVAYSAAAVPETIGNSGIVLSRKTPALVAGAVQRIVSDKSLADQMREAQQAQLERFTLNTTRAQLLAALEKVL